jgi:hypothetical protein
MVKKKKKDFLMVQTGFFMVQRGVFKNSSFFGSLKTLFLTVENSPIIEISH